MPYPPEHFKCNSMFDEQREVHDVAHMQRIYTKESCIHTHYCTCNEVCVAQRCRFIGNCAKRLGMKYIINFTLFFWPGLSVML